MKSSLPLYANKTNDLLKMWTVKNIFNGISELFAKWQNSNK